MLPKSHLISHLKNSGVFVLTFSCMLLVVSCNDPVSPPLPLSGIALLAPKGGEIFKTTDTVKIIFTANYDDFSSGTYTEFNLDSNKSNLWDAVKALPPRSGIVTDTVAWFPTDYYPDSVFRSTGILVRVRDYNNEFIARSSYILFTN